MSSNNIVIKSENFNKNTEYSRDSFDQRVCDDLTQVLISYLSFEDKIRFECLSKQFQDLVFKKQKKLKIHSICFDPNITFGFDLKAFESVLTKCKSLNDIAILICGFGVYRNEEVVNNHENQVIQLVIKHCLQLKSIQWDYCTVDIDLIESFGRKFGPNLVHIDMSRKISASNRQTLIRLSPNLVSIKGLRLKDLMIGNEFIVLKRLSKLERLTIGRENSLFRDFIDKYENQLTSLDIYCTENFSVDVFIDISRLKHLTEISLLSNEDSFDFYLRNNTIPLFNALTKIGLNCKKLNKLTLDLTIFVDYDTKLLCQSLNAFKNVKTLKLVRNPFSLKFELFCDGIETRFPKLESLEFHSSYFNDNGLKCLAKLKTLKKFVICGYYNSNLTSEGILDLINSNNKLFYIDIKSNFEITDQLIDGFKALTVRNPKSVYKINLNFRSNNDNESKLSGIPGIDCLKPVNYINQIESNDTLWPTDMVYLGDQLH